MGFSEVCYVAASRSAEMLVNGSDENISEVVGPAEMLVNGLAENIGELVSREH